MNNYFIHATKCTSGIIQSEIILLNKSLKTYGHDGSYYVVKKVMDGRFSEGLQTQYGINIRCN